MKYNYYFDVASLIASVFLLAIYAMRRTLRTKSNKILLLLLICDVLGSAFDYASCFCISFPEQYPMWFNYLTAYGYLFFYNMMGVLFFAFIDAKTKIEAMWKPSAIIVAVVSIVEGVLIWTSPFTKLVSYYDENLEYQHGPLMLLLYILAGSLLFASIVLFVIGRKRFNRYQVLAIVLFVIAVFMGVLIQIMVPRLLVGQFACTLVLFFLYTSLENPVYYTYLSTTCYNRLSFLETMKVQLRKEEEIHLFAFAIKDYEYFKENLSLKNLERLSCNIAEFIHLHYGDYAFCIADDKFIIRMRTEDEAPAILNRLEQYFLKPVILVDTHAVVSIRSTVVKHLDKNIKTDMIENVITYLLEHGGNAGDDPDLFNKTVERLKRQKAIANIVKEAIFYENFEVYYQPIRNVETGKFSSVEALIRLNSKEFGFISPEEFIPIAENEGMIYDIGEQVLESVCRFIKESNCMNELGVHYVEINLSPLQCFQADLVKKFTDIMEKYEVDPQWINLEFTETASFENNRRMSQNIISLYEMGITFSLDDYGSGFATIDYLFKLPVDIVKIDKTILWRAMKDKNAQVILVSTLKMLKDLGKDIVVEGVEDEKMVKLLSENGCDYMQGYYYSKPIPEGEYIEFLKKNNLEGAEEEAEEEIEIKETEVKETEVEETEIEEIELKETVMETKETETKAKESETEKAEGKEPEIKS